MIKEKIKKSHILFAALLVGILMSFDFALAQSCPALTTVEGTSVTFVGEITEMGGDTTTYVWFEYGQTTSLGQKTAERTLSQEGIYCITVSGLSPSITYYYRAGARNTAGTSYGDVKSFTTTAGPTFNYSLFNSGNISLVQGSSGSNIITASLFSGTSQSVSFSLSGLPAGANYSGLTSCGPTCSRTLTISTLTFTPDGTYPITVTGSPLGKTTIFNLIVSSQPNNSPTANAGPDKEVFENSSITILGSGSDPDGDSLNYRWSCNGGTFSDPNIAQPIFFAPSVSQNTTYVCTLTVTDSYGASDSDSMRILVKVHQSPDLSVSLTTNPSSGCAPLNNVDLTATVSGTAVGSITYFFDCTNNGTWERIRTSSNSSYMASNLCDYTSSGTYRAKARVEREGLVAEETTQINVNSCVETAPTLTVNKLVRNLTDNTGWQNSVSADPGDLLSFSIEITSTGDTTANNVWLEDTLSTKLIYRGNLRIDGVSSGRDIFDGFSLGSLNSGQSKTITFEVRVASENEFARGTTNLVNTARTWANTVSQISDTAIARVYRAPASTPADFSVSKLVRNLSDGTAFLNSVPADPREVLIFRIKVKAGEGSLSKVIVKDTLPGGITYVGDLRVDNVLTSGNILTGLNIGNLAAEQEKIITFRADVTGPENFAFGQTELTNTALVSGDAISRSDTAKVIVSKTAVAGAATAVATGITDNIFFDSFLLPLIVAFLIVWLFKSRILKFEQWLDSRKKEYQIYKSKKILQIKIAKAKAKEFFQRL